jgi:aspartate kinase
MRVMKFGGTSVGDPARVSNLCEIVRSTLSHRPVVVVSAASKVTDMLLAAAAKAAHGEVEVAPIETRITSLIDAFGVDRAIVSQELLRLREALAGVARARTLGAEASDLIASYGERISVRFVAATLRAKGIEAMHHDAFDVGMLTDANFGAAEPLAESEAALRDAVSSVVARGVVPVITGFIGRTRDGRITTLGRGGSDYSAAIIGAAVGADEIEIWTDVPGVMSSDPRVVPEAHTIPALSFDEAAELAYFGAKVLHPKTIHPAVRRGIPVRVKNTFEPAHPGTVVTARGDEHARGARAIAHKKGIAVVSVVSTRMLLAHGFLARIFEVFARHEVVVDLVATSEVSVSCTVDNERGLSAALDELRAIGDVSIARAKTLVCVVAAGLFADPEVCPRIFAALGAEGVPVELISMGASAINVSVVVPEADGERAVRALHRALFTREGTSS